MWKMQLCTPAGLEAWVAYPGPVETLAAAVQGLGGLQCVAYTLAVEGPDGLAQVQHKGPTPDEPAVWLVWQQGDCIGVYRTPSGALLRALAACSP